jgi:DNA replication protein DnaC
MALAKIEVLALDDWALQPLEPYGREYLLEIMDDRAEKHATVITAQLPIGHWHGWIGDATIADVDYNESCIGTMRTHHTRRVRSRRIARQNETLK